MHLFLHKFLTLPLAFHVYEASHACITDPRVNPHLTFKHEWGTDWAGISRSGWIYPYFTGIFCISWIQHAYSGIIVRNGNDFNNIT